MGAIPLSAIPDGREAADLYREVGGSITMFPKFGTDPLEACSDLKDRRNHEFSNRYPEFAPLFYTVVNSNYTPFCEALSFFILITHSLSTEL